MSRSGPLIAGEPVLLIDRKKRRYLIDLAEGGEFHSHSGVLPHDELIAKLESLTNLRAVRDETASTGWSIEIGPFPGWEEVPEW